MFLSVISCIITPETRALESIMPVYGSMTHTYSGRKIKKKKVKGEVYAKYKAPKFTAMQTTKQPSYADLRMAEATQYKSNTDFGEYNEGKVDSKKYTGTFVKGISTMHKSNAVPVIDDQEIIDHARMRR